MNSRPRGLEKLKMENGYTGKGPFMGHRRSTGQRYCEQGLCYRPEQPKKLNGKEKQRSNETVEKRNFLVFGDEMVDGWPKWLIDNIPKEALGGLVPKGAESYDKLDKIGQGTYSNVYKARDRETGKIVALKKVRFDTSEPESVKFMAQEIIILQKLDHPNIVKLEGLATSRIKYSLYLVFEFIQSDLERIISRPESMLTEPQIKCYMHQLLSGLQHCHERGSTDYGVGIDLWSAGCLLAEMFARRPIMPGRTEVIQSNIHEGILEKVGTVYDFPTPHSYKPSLVDALSNFPQSSLGLLSTLLALDPAYRGSASSALKNEFFHTSPLGCDLSGLPVVYNKDDEADQQKKHRNPKPKQRSRTLDERRKQDEVAE
ncbi:hypothetical protein PTKIN_Ptkin09bG0156000 [Pterospermum kingtungense]